MSTRPSTFRQRGLTRAIKAALAAGMVVERAWVEVDGRIMLAFANGHGHALEEAEQGNPWDKALLVERTGADNESV
jgi:hypothetical protein